MSSDNDPSVPAGWVGGFSTSKDAFAYPHPDFSSIKMYDNMKHIDNLQRQQKVIWPEFSWETKMGRKDPKRCFQMFAPDISRIGYDNSGRVWSIMCPQQGVCIKGVCLNVEVTVTGQRGWVNEADRDVSLAADMTVEGKIWFGPSSHNHWFVKGAAELFAEIGTGEFPFTKEHAIRVSTHKVGEPDQPIFPVLKGVSQRFDPPPFTDHSADAWTVGNIDVQIGPIVPTDNPNVDQFNQSILGFFNMGSGNMLQKGNVLTWNVWFKPPELVNQREWSKHAERWRRSIDADHGPESSPAKYADGSPYEVSVNYFRVFRDLHNIIESL